MPAKGQIILALGTSKYHQNRFHRTPKYHLKGPRSTTIGTLKSHHNVPRSTTITVMWGVSKYHYRSIFRGPEVPPGGFEIPIVHFRLSSAESLCLAGGWGSRSTTTQVTIGTLQYHREGPEVPLYAVAIFLGSSLVHIGPQPLGLRTHQATRPHENPPSRRHGTQAEQAREHDVHQAYRHEDAWEGGVGQQGDPTKSTRC